VEIVSRGLEVAGNGSGNAIRESAPDGCEIRPAIPKPQVPSADASATKRTKRTASNGSELERYDTEWRLIAKFTDRVFAVGRLCFPVMLNETSGPIYKISYDNLTIILQQCQSYDRLTTDV